MSKLNNKNAKNNGQQNAGKSSASSNPWHSKDQKLQFDPKKDEKTTKNSVKKFQKVQLEHIQAAKKHVQNYESSSDEEEEIECGALIASVFKEYNGESNQLRKTQEFLENIFQTGAATCLICIATVKRSDYVIFL